MNYAGDPQFCAIAPILYSDLAFNRKSHLVLAHLIDSERYTGHEKELSARYTAFIKSEADAGSFIMMDNSAYELKEPYAPEKLMTLATLCGAHAIVLPDYPFCPAAKTIEAAKKFAPIFKENGFKTFFVPQSKRGDVDDWVEAYDWAANDEGHDLVDIIGISILGVPNALPNIDPSFARVVMMQRLLDDRIFNSNKHHHFLGLNAGPGLEIPSLLRMRVLDTIDSSGPVWAGICGHRYNVDSDSLQQVRKLTSPVDFFLPRSKDESTIKRITYNIQLTDELFSGNRPVNSWYAEE